MLVDGDELAKGTDPSKYNTDGDTTSDYDEIGLGRNPLLKDMHVTVNFARLFVAKDADAANDSGDFRFQFDVVDGSGAVKPGLKYFNGTTSQVAPKCADEDGWLCWFNDTKDGGTVVHINDGRPWSSRRGSPSTPVSSPPARMSPEHRHQGLPPGDGRPGGLLRVCPTCRHPPATTPVS